jgi:uncharacterized protein YigE (DUF2233 family)
LRLAVTDPNGKALRNFAGLSRTFGADTARVRFAMNAGMFGTDSMPIGLYIENGVTRRRINRVQSAHGNFYMQPNGVLWIGRDGSGHIDATTDFGARNPAARWATQSGPMLVISGKVNPQFSADGPSRYIRNGVGDQNNGTLVFVISEDAVSFGRFARFFRDVLKSRNALYLDGAISSLWIPRNGRMDAGHQLGPLVVVLDKNRQ